MKNDYKYQMYVGDPPEQMCFVDDAIEVSYFTKALETRLKYCPDQKVGIIISAESARRILKALKGETKHEQGGCNREKQKRDD